MRVWNGAGSRPVRRGRKRNVSHDAVAMLNSIATAGLSLCFKRFFLLFFFLFPVAKALQEFDLALRGKKKRKKFVQDTKKKAQMTVSSFVDKWDPGQTIIVFPLAKLHITKTCILTPFSQRKGHSLRS